MKEYIKSIGNDEVKRLNKGINECIGIVRTLREGINLKVYTSQQVCEMLGINAKLLRQYRYNGMLAYSRVGDKYWYTQKDIDEFMENNKRPAFC